MAGIVIRRGDLEIEIQDASDLQLALDALGEGQAAVAAGSQSKSKVPSTGQVVQVTAPSGELFRRFYEGLGGEYAKRFVRALYDSPNGLSDAQVRRALDLESNLKLAGISSGIAKGERRAGLPAQAAVKREKRGNVGDYSYRYWLTRECRQALESLMMPITGQLKVQNGGASA